jgi:hypothetical protein
MAPPQHRYYTLSDYTLSEGACSGFKGGLSGFRSRMVGHGWSQVNCFGHDSYFGRTEYASCKMIPAFYGRISTQDAKTYRKVSILLYRNLLTWRVSMG